VSERTSSDGERQDPLEKPKGESLIPTGETESWERSQGSPFSCTKKIGKRGLRKNAALGRGVTLERKKESPTTKDTAWAGQRFEKSLDKKGPGGQERRKGFCTPGKGAESPQGARGLGKSNLRGRTAIQPRTRERKNKFCEN